MKDYYEYVYYFSDKFLNDRLILLENSKNNLVLIDPPSPPLGISSANTIRMTHPDIWLILIFETCSHALRAQAHDSGADGILLKGSPYRPFVSFLADLIGKPGAQPEPCITAASRHITLPDDQQAKQDFESLTRRERQIVEHLVCGKSNKTIARDLDITEATVKVHLKVLLKKLRVENRTQAALYAEHYGPAALSAQPAGENVQLAGRDIKY